MKYQLWRHPVLQEDEGRPYLVGTRDTAEEIKLLWEQEIGFFHRTDFIIKHVRIK